MLLTLKKISTPRHKSGIITKTLHVIFLPRVHCSGNARPQAPLQHLPASIGPQGCLKDLVFRTKPPRSNRRGILDLCPQFFASKAFSLTFLMRSPFL
ncbi:hypothetical protein [Desulfovibrio desulfuricans]|uniref:hypothetical protein n=1 Tax=Desulfovibrio desulfuricans TaxID=876 RepID=UPI0039842296